MCLHVTSIRHRMLWFHSHFCSCEWWFSMYMCNGMKWISCLLRIHPFKLEMMTYTQNLKYVSVFMSCISCWIFSLEDVNIQARQPSTQHSLIFLFLRVIHIKLVKGLMLPTWDSSSANRDKDLFKMAATWKDVFSIHISFSISTDHFTAVLSVRQGQGPDYVDTNFTFFDCNTYMS